MASHDQKPQSQSQSLSLSSSAALSSHPSASTTPVAAAAAVAVALLVATAMHAAHAPPTAPDELVGYVLLVIGYLLLPAVGVMLVRRNRELHATRALLSAQEDVYPTLADTDELSSTNTTTRDATTPKRAASRNTDWRDVRCAAQRGLFFARAAPDARALARDVDLAAAVRPCAEHGHCAVCLSDIEAGDKVRQLPCGHCFHPACAELWLVTARKNSCPLCAARVCDGRDAAMRPVR